VAEQRLIDANALEFEYDPIDGIMNKVLILGGRNVGKTKHIIKTALKQMIDNAPTIDAVEVVKCKDCTHRYVPARCALWVGNENGKDIFLERGDDFFCKYGERKDTEVCMV